MNTEIGDKLASLRSLLAAEEARGVRLRGVDWFAWATGGGDASVLFSQEEGVAEVFVTETKAFLLTNRIEARRIREEELPAGFLLEECAWDEPGGLDLLVARNGGSVLSDRPSPGERSLPLQFRERRWRLHPAEQERYRELGRAAAAAATEALGRAGPRATEQEIAGAAAQALWSRGIHPLLTLVGGERRGSLYRHAIAKSEAVGGRATLVICGRRHGLFANLTRHVFFREPTKEERASAEKVAAVEAVAWDSTAQGKPLPEIFTAMREAYTRQGLPGQETLHHQGGVTGYLARELVVNEHTPTSLAAEPGMVFAWNPSLPGAKIEDTFLLGNDGEIEVLTVDPEWPAFSCSGRMRPAPWVRV